MPSSEPQWTSKFPGKPSRGSTTGRPLMVLLDILGQKWTLRILWELQKSKRLSFRGLRTACDEVSPTLLNRRLKMLRELAFVDLEKEGFGLTRLGDELTSEFARLDSWANRWADQFNQ